MKTVENLLRRAVLQGVHDAKELDPEQSRRWVKEPWSFCAEGGEPMRSVYARMREAILSAEEDKIPANYVTLTNEDDVKNMNKLLDMLEEDEDINDVYHNWENEE